MNVRPTPPNPYAAPVAEAGGIRASANTRKDATSQQGARPEASAVSRKDVVELSPQARIEAAAAEQARAESPELESARVALRAQPGLSAERMQALKQQVASGHYDTPEAITQIASAVAQGL